MTAPLSNDAAAAAAVAAAKLAESIAIITKEIYNDKVLYDMRYYYLDDWSVNLLVDNNNNEKRDLMSNINSSINSVTEVLKELKKGKSILAASTLVNEQQQIIATPIPGAANGALGAAVSLEESIILKYDAKLKYADEEYIHIHQLYTTLYEHFEHFNHLSEYDVIGTRTPFAPCIVGGGDPPDVQSIGEEFMPESYYDKQQSELIIEYLIFISEKSFIQFQKLCIFLFNITYKIFIKLILYASTSVILLIKAGIFAVLQFILTNYLKPIFALFENLNPFKTSLENKDEIIKEHEKQLALQRQQIEEHEIAIRDLQAGLYDQSNVVDYTWVFNKLITVASGPILLAIKNHAQQHPLDVGPLMLS